MTSKLKCLFCQTELEGKIGGWEYGCTNDECQSAGTLCGTKELWQALIQAKQDLENAKIALKEIRQKGLDNSATQFAMGFIADQALYKMEHKEQKNAKRNSAK